MSIPPSGASLAVHLVFYDWAIFSYFTTFQRHHFTFVTGSSTQFSRFVATLDRGARVADYPSASTRLADLRRATFSDDDEEGWIALRLAEESGEALPLLLCEIRSSEEYRLWSPEEDERDPSAWFTAPLSRLEEVAATTVTTTHGETIEYRLVRATDPTANLEIWSMASRDERIAELTLSSHCDAGGLIAWLQRSTDVGPLQLPDDLCSWSYGLVYGGGSDEHLAVFRARESRATQRVWELVAQSSNPYTSAISRF